MKNHKKHKKMAKERIIQMLSTMCLKISSKLGKKRSRIVTEGQTVQA